MTAQIIMKDRGCVNSTKSIPNPGSAAAGEQGCKCPILDNVYGRGYMGESRFVINENCLLHNPPKEKLKFQFKGYALLTNGQKAKIVSELFKLGFLSSDKIIPSKFLFDDILAKDWVTPETLRTVTAYVLKVSPKALE